MALGTEAFFGEVRAAFADVAERLGLDGPGRAEVDRHLAVATYSGSGVTYNAVLGLWQGDIEIHACRATAWSECKVGVEGLALAAGVVGRRGGVTFGARSVRQLRKSLTGQVRCVELVHPLISGEPDSALRLMRAAGAREWRKPAMR
ncbi:hypothetical protein [Streptomyces mangrovisoli]|uniref:Uncharacterized protein n=1 Tax=Streptomyces mangrovisoli TaxID=1428628 RepID=A0A1J4NP60_9ACTN|nr:hypothetical protein [Streptomyces mangrovisoli]OIJ64217.1 hypothetical protein WN71_030160 [Streptomyces mangrovisoli]